MSLYPLNGGGVQADKPPLSIAFNEGVQIVDVKEATPITVDNVRLSTYSDVWGRAMLIPTVTAFPTVGKPIPHYRQS